MAETRSTSLRQIFLLSLIGLLGLFYTLYTLIDLAQHERKIAYDAFSARAQGISYFLRREVDRMEERMRSVQGFVNMQDTAIEDFADMVSSAAFPSNSTDILGLARGTAQPVIIAAVGNRHGQGGAQLVGRQLYELDPGLRDNRPDSSPRLRVITGPLEDLSLDRALMFTQRFRARDGREYIYFEIADLALFLLDGLLREDGTTGFSVSLISDQSDDGLSPGLVSLDPLVGQRLAAADADDIWVYRQSFVSGQAIWHIDIVAAKEAFPPDYGRVYLAASAAAVLGMLILCLLWLLVLRNRRVNALVQRRTAALRQLNSELADNYRLLQQMNHDLDEARRAAESANQAKSGFLATISHELRTPLNAILGFSDMLEKQTLGPIGDPRYVDYARDIKSSGDHLLSLINDILDLAKLEAGKTLIDSSAVSIDSVVEAVRALLASNAEDKGLSFDIEMSSDLPPAIIGDSLRLRQILINLLGNAIKFTEEGGVTLSINPVRSEDEDEESIEFRVHDTGPGIDEDHLRTLFDRFTQADEGHRRTQGGVGLGLAICRELVQLMQGEIRCESELGEGTTFIVTLPMTRSECCEETADVI